MTKVLVIIVTFNAHDWIRICLNSINLLKYYVIVVDNNSSDDTVNIIKNEYPNVILSVQNENSGFGQANNIGLQKAIDEDYDYVLLLNQDAWVLPNTIDGLIAAHRSNQVYGVLSPMQHNSITNSIEKQFEVYVKRYHVDVFSKEIQPVEFANAAIWLISKQCLAQVGGFDPLFPHYGEDTDYLQRVHYNGLKVGVLPKVVAYHDRENSIQHSVKKEIYKTTLVYIGYIKNVNQSLIKGYFKCLKIFLSKIAKSIITMDVNLLRINVVALCNVCKQTSKVIKHRKLSLNERAFLK